MSAPREASSPWARAALAAALFAIDYRGTGVALRAAPGPVRDAWLEALKAMLPPEAPWRRAPASIADDRLLGGLDLAATLRAGQAVAQPGVLVEADGGVLCLAMAERIPSANAARIAAALDQGAVRLAREGLARDWPTKFGLVALDEGLEDEEPPSSLTERLAYLVDLSAIGRRDLAGPLFSAEEIAQARARAGAVEASEAAVEALVAVAARLGVASIRAPLFALRAARALAALDGRDRLDDEDIAMAAALTLAPRATRAPSPDEEPAAPDSEDNEPPPDTSETPDDERQEGAFQPELEDVVLAAARAAISPDLLAKLASKASPRKSGSDGKSGADSLSKRRGRPLGARAGALRDGRLDLIATLRAAAPWQALRAREGAPGRTMFIRPEDLRIQRYRQKRGSTTVFVVDASGSSAVQRLAEVKGAIELLLADCYVRRDAVALIAFRHKSAEIVLPPTRSTARAKRALAALPGGGGTPVASGIDAALGLADQIRRKGQTPLIVLMTDGRANVGRDGAPGRPAAFRDALEAAGRVRAAGVVALAIDTAPPFGRADAPTRALADAMQARYVPLPYADAAKLNRAVRSAAGT